MPAGDAGALPCRCGSGRGEGTRLIRGRIRVPAPLASPGVSGWRDGGALEEEKERSEKAMVRVTCLSPACSEVFRCREGSVRRGVGSGGFSPGERGAAGAAGRGARTAAVSRFYTT